MPVTNRTSIAVEPLEAGNRIGRDPLIGMADMRRAIGVGYRGRDIEGGRALMNLQSQSFARRSPEPVRRPVSERRRPRRRRQIGEQGQDERPLVQIEGFGLARRLAEFFPYKGIGRKPPRN